MVQSRPLFGLFSSFPHYTIYTSVDIFPKVVNVQLWQIFFNFLFGENLRTPADETYKSTLFSQCKSGWGWAGKCYEINNKIPL